MQIIDGLLVSETHTAAMREVSKERGRQISKWGDQFGKTLGTWLAILGEEYGEVCRRALEATIDGGRGVLGMSSYTTR